jgi:molybdate transport system substrate-binding protein
VRDGMRRTQCKAANMLVISHVNQAVMTTVRAALVAIFASLFIAATARAEIQVLAPPVVANAGLKDIAAAFTKKTGIAIAIRSLELLKIPENVPGQPTDIVFVTPDLMNRLVMENNIQRSSIAAVGRANIGLAVRTGAPHPDISTVEKLIASLRAFKGVAYSNPDPARGSLGAAIIDRLLKRPDFSGVHGVISSKGNGASGLINGEGDSALQFESEILPHKEIELVGPLPQELGAYVDISGAVTQKSSSPSDAQAFMKFITSPESTPLWEAGGLSTPGH